MNQWQTLAAAAILLFAATFSEPSFADSFGSGANSFDIDFVTIGDAGNAEDLGGFPVPAGKVEYEYRIAKFEVSEGMIDAANANGDLGITHFGRGPSKPATSISWFEATRFVNWLNTSTGSPPAYKYDDSGTFQGWAPSDPGYDSNNLYRNSLAKYFLPSTDEWYKAAYYDPIAEVYYDFPTGSDETPVPVSSGTASGTAVFLGSEPADITQAGGPSPYGTVGQGGNAMEWLETHFNQADHLPPALMRVRGGFFRQGSDFLRATSQGRYRANLDTNSISIRVASRIPEPTAVALALIVLTVLLALRRTRSVAACNTV